MEFISLKKNSTAKIRLQTNLVSVVYVTVPLSQSCFFETLLTMHLSLKEIASTAKMGIEEKR